MSRCLHRVNQHTKTCIYCGERLRGTHHGPWDFDFRGYSDPTFYLNEETVLKDYRTVVTFDTYTTILENL